MSYDEHRETLLPSSEQSLPIHTQHGLSRSEIVQGIASRFIYSRFYTILYLGLAVLCFISIILSLFEKCPSTLFVILEVIINIAMIVEVSIRMVAVGRSYFFSCWNLFDLLLVFLCFSTLVFIVSGECSEGGREEAILDTFLLIIRYLIQFSRLGMMLKKNNHTFNTRTQRIDFADVRDTHSTDLRGTSIDFAAFEPDTEGAQPTHGAGVRPFVLEDAEEDEF